MNPSDILTVGAFVTEFNQMKSELMQEIHLLRGEIALLGNSKKKVNRLKASQYLGLSYSQMGTISYEKGIDKPKGKKRVPFVRVGGSLLYEMEDLKAEKERFINQAV
jgi:hypothetical protein